MVMGRAPHYTGRMDRSVAVRLPAAPALVAGARRVAWVSADGEAESLDSKTAADRLATAPPIVCHARATARRLGSGPFAAYDVLELFAFVRPAQFCLPTPRGLAAALGLRLPETLEDEATTLFTVAHGLLVELAAAPSPAPTTTSTAATTAAAATAAAMAPAWSWGTAVLAALGADADASPRARGDAFRIWMRLPEWEERGPELPPDNKPVEAMEARARLVKALAADEEERPEQMDYASQVSEAFQPRDRAGEPNVVVAEAGTGVGKTLGYLAPAQVWAAKNAGPVWVSTFTRNLQRQLDGELDRLYPDAEEKRRAVVVRKGRENYLCLLNFEEAGSGLPMAGGGEPVALGLMARWALASRDGDMIGGDFPAWLADLVGRGLTLDLTDSRGECIYSGCRHYGRCFIERSIRRARRAEIVVANHALVMIQAALGGGDEASLPTRYVFDEGHHVFGAADAAFSAHLSGRETAELRRWILGAEGRRRSRARGLDVRLRDLVVDEAAAAALDETLRAAHALPGPGWLQRIAGGAPIGPAESFLAVVRQQVYARDQASNSPYGLETETAPPVPGLIEEAAALDGSLLRLATPVAALIGALNRFLDDHADELETAARLRIEAFCRGLERRAVLQVAAWRQMLESLNGETPPEFVDWFSTERQDGQDIDVGFHRHWVDPVLPFIEAVAEPAQGILLTSASLRDGSGDEENDWMAAETRVGSRHLRQPASRVAVASPFDYPATTRVLVVGDVRRDDPAQVAAAYRELFLAGGGGGLGLFTAISRLRAVHQRIAGPLDEAGVVLLAQHVDGLDVGTLVDIFRAEEDACLLGTDAVRDGVDVPGRSLRLIVFDRVPWPRPDILHRARREAFGGRAYDEMLTRLRLKQAFGRLVRRHGDRGVFVMLDRAMPSRLGGAFPDGVEIQRLGLAEAIAETRDFLAP